MREPESSSVKRSAGIVTMTVMDRLMLMLLLKMMMAIGGTSITSRQLNSRGSLSSSLQRLIPTYIFCRDSSSLPIPQIYTPKLFFPTIEKEDRADT